MNKSNRHNIFFLNVSNSLELTALTNLKDTELYFGRDIYLRLGYIKMIYSNVQRSQV